MAGQPGFFDLDERYAALSAAGDPLERLSDAVDFELFRPVLKAALRRSDRSKGGRPPYDPVLMFKILVLQALYSLSDDAAEFLIRDRLSFMRFLGLGLGERVPDAKVKLPISHIKISAAWVCARANTRRTSANKKALTMTPDRRSVSIGTRPRVLANR